MRRKGAATTRSRYRNPATLPGLWVELMCPPLWGFSRRYGGGGQKVAQGLRRRGGSGQRLARNASTRLANAALSSQYGRCPLFSKTASSDPGIARWIAHATDGATL